MPNKRMSRQVPWPRILIEAVAIVASILLAFAIDAWWERQGERKEERESLELLARDLAATIEQLGDFRADVQGTAQISMRAYAALSGDPSEQEQASVSEMLARALSRRTLRLPRAGYTDLLSTGGLRLIRDRSLRDDIVRFYELAQLIEEVVEKNSAIFTDGHLAAVLIREGLVLKRPAVPGRNPRDTEINQALQNVLDSGFEHRPDPIWLFGSESREWDRARSALLQNARGAQSAVWAADQLVSEASNLRGAIGAYLDET